MLALESSDKCVAAYFEHFLIEIVLLFTSEREKEKKNPPKDAPPHNLCIEKH